MPTVEVKNTEGKKVGSLDLDDSVWAVDVNEHLLWEVVKWQRAKKRAGTHSTKTVAEVRGSGKKPFRQKGTGRARQGDTRAHHHVGGGRAFGPKPRDYSYEIPKKVRKGALRSALSLRLKENQLVVLDKFDLSAPKTREVAKTLGNLGLSSVLIVDGKENEGLVRGARNLARAKWLAPEGLNVYDLLNYDALVLTSESAKRIEASLKGKKA